jgi:hypothetical protein
MEPIIDLAPGAEENPLATHFSQLIGGNLQRDSRRAWEFRALRGAVLMVAQDSATSLTMRFDHGRLTLHDGVIGIPSVTFCGDEQVLFRLSKIAFHQWLKIPKLGVLHRSASIPFRELVDHVTSGDLKIYGLVAHPRLVFTLLRLLSNPAQ